MIQTVISHPEGPLIIRTEQLEDYPAIRAINESAFETSAEADLVAVLREQAQPIVSLVAEAAGKIVGHIMLSPVDLLGYPDMRIMGLAPMAVSPSHQRKGIGSELVLSGFDECRKLTFGAMVVVGHTDYYPRFGFLPGANFNLSCEYDVPEDVFMAIELQNGYLDDVSGQIRYHRAFNDL